MAGLRAPIYRGRAGWAGNIHHDDGGGGGLGRLGLAFLLDGREGAEEELIDVGEDGGAARGNAVLGEQDHEFGEEVMNLGGGVELAEQAGEGGGEVGVGGIGLPILKARMAKAESGMRVQDAQTAAAAFAGEMAAAGVVGGAGFGVFISHFEPR